eukprot:gene14413-18240_t
MRSEAAQARRISGGLRSQAPERDKIRSSHSGNNHLKDDYMADTPQIAIIMGSRSDWGVMKAAATILDQLDVAYEARVVSAH